VFHSLCSQENGIGTSKPNYSSTGCDSENLKTGRSPQKLNTREQHLIRSERFIIFITISVKLRGIPMDGILSKDAIANSSYAVR